MTQILRIANFDQTDTYDLLAGTLCVNAEGRVTNTNQNGLVEDRFLVWGASATSETDLQDAAIELDTFSDKVYLWQTDTLKSDSIWLEESTTEENARRSLIYSLTLTRYTNNGISPIMNRKQFWGQLVILHHPAWENVTSHLQESVTPDGTWHGTRVVPTYTGLATITSFAFPSYGSYFAITGSGTYPSRVAKMTIQNPGNATSGTPMTTFWAGIRPIYEGYSSFDPTLILQYGTFGTDAFGVISADAVAGGAVACDFATVDTLDRRITLKISDVTGSNYNHYIGKYLVLLRYFVGYDPTTLIGVQLVGDGVTENEEKFLTETSSYSFVELGFVQIPRVGLRTEVNSLDVANVTIGLNAEKITGIVGDAIHFDCLVLIPIQHMVKITNGNFNITDANSAIEVYTQENDEITTNNFSTSATSFDSAAVDVEPTDWAVPIEGGILVAACSRDDETNIDDTFEIEFEMYTRWRNYRSTN